MPDTNVKVETVDQTKLQEIINDWIDLHENASQPLSSFCPLLTLSMLKHLPQYKNIRTLIVTKEIENRSQLLCVFPYEVSNYRWLIPKKCLTAMRNGFFCNGIPLIRNGYESIVWEKLIEYLRTTPNMAKIIYLDRFRYEGNSFETLQTKINKAEQSNRYFNQHQRAILKSELSYEEYVSQLYDKKGKKELKNTQRRFRRLTEKGNVTFEYVTEPNKIPEYLEVFLELENRGWKGKRGTSLLADPHRTNMLRELASNSSKEAGIRFHVLKLDEKVISISLNYISSGCMIALKPAYDENFRVYGPGHLLAERILENKLENNEIKYIDSNTTSGHFLEHIWMQKTQTGSFYFSVKEGKDSVFEFCMALESLRLNTRDFLKKKINHYRFQRQEQNNYKFKLSSS